MRNIGQTLEQMSRGKTREQLATESNEFYKKLKWEILQKEMVYDDIQTKLRKINEFKELMAESDIHINRLNDQVALEKQILHSQGNTGYIGPGTVNRVGYTGYTEYNNYGVTIKDPSQIAIKPNLESARNHYGVEGNDPEFMAVKRTLVQDHLMTDGSWARISGAGQLLGFLDKDKNPVKLVPTEKQLQAYYNPTDFVGGKGPTWYNKLSEWLAEHRLAIAAPIAFLDMMLFGHFSFGIMIVAGVLSAVLPLFDKYLYKADYGYDENKSSHFPILDS